MEEAATPAPSPHAPPASASAPAAATTATVIAAVTHFLIRNGRHRRAEQQDLRAPPPPLPACTPLRPPPPPPPPRCPTAAAAQEGDRAQGGDPGQGRPTQCRSSSTRPPSPKPAPQLRECRLGIATATSAPTMGHLTPPKLLMRPLLPEWPAQVTVLTSTTGALAPRPHQRTRW